MKERGDRRPKILHGYINRHTDTVNSDDAQLFESSEFFWGEKKREMQKEKGGFILLHIAPSLAKQLSSQAKISTEFGKRRNGKGREKMLDRIQDSASNEQAQFKVRSSFSKATLNCFYIETDSSLFRCFYTHLNMYMMVIICPNVCPLYNGTYFAEHINS